MIVRRGVTRTVFVGPRWAVKVPRLQMDRPSGWRAVHSEIGWVVRGWLANRSEWRQRHRADVARPVLTFGHFAVVFPAAIEVGDDRLTDPGPGPWVGFEDIEDGRRRDELKPSSWGRFPDGWRIIDFDRAWDQNGRGIIGSLYFGNQERLARKWSKL